MGKFTDFLKKLGEGIGFGAEDDYYDEDEFEEEEYTTEDFDAFDEKGLQFELERMQGLIKELEAELRQTFVSTDKKESPKNAQIRKMEQERLLRNLKEERLYEEALREEINRRKGNVSEREFE